MELNFRLNGVSSLSATSGHDPAQVRGRDVVLGEDVGGVRVRMDDDLLEAVVAGARADGRVGRQQGQRFVHSPGDQAKDEQDQEDPGFGKQGKPGIVRERRAAIWAALIAVVGQLVAYFASFHRDHPRRCCCDYIILRRGSREEGVAKREGRG